ncbi:hypothetical protein G6M12_01955 [Agrobacterium tumefaciens]|nr:hypothetical protein [Agrobacterium tumefaciens]
MNFQSRFSLTSFSESAAAVLNQCSIFIYTVGYEQRSSYFSDMFYNDSAFCGAFVYKDSTDLGKFKDNIQKFRKRGHTSVGTNIEEIRKSLRPAFDSKPTPRTIVVDISCMDRYLLASLFLTIFEMMNAEDVLHVLYTPNEFSEPDFTFPTLNYFGPAVPELNGRVGDFSRECCLIMGLGYEYGASLNVLERLEPAVSYLYLPTGHDDRFLPSVRQANFDFDFGIRNLHFNDFYLANADEAYRDISSIVLALKHSMAIALVPFGPKLFSFICLLVAMENAGDVSFLRYSVNNDKQSSTLKASGITYGVTLSGIDRSRWTRALKDG